LYFSREEDFGIIFVTNGSNASAGTRGSFNNVEEALIDTLYEEIVKE
jgi:hypothetical protein